MSPPELIFTDPKNGSVSFLTLLTIGRVGSGSRPHRAPMAQTDLFAQKTPVTDASKSADLASTVTCPKCGHSLELWEDRQGRRMTTCDVDGYSRYHALTKIAQFSLIPATHSNPSRHKSRHSSKWTRQDGRSGN